MNHRPGGVYLYVPWVFDRLGGVDVIVDQLFFALSAEGHDVRIAEQSWEGYTEWEDNDGRRFAKINFVTLEPVVGQMRRVRGLISFIRHSLVTLYRLHVNRIRVVNAHFPTKHLFMLSLLKRLGIWRGRIVLSFHGSDVNELDFGDKSWRSILDHADAITTCSGALKEKLESKIGCDRYPLQVVYNGIDTQKLVALAEDPRWAFEPEFEGDYLVCLANFVPHKGQDLLLNAFAGLHSSYPDLQLVLAGGRNNGEWARQLEAQADKLGISEAVHFIFDVPHERVPALLKRAQAMVLASRYEAFGLVVAEAAVLKTPVVATDVGGLPELIPSAAHGWLTPVEDIGALEKSLNDVLRDALSAKKIALYQSQYVIEHFSTKRMSDNYLSILFNG